MKKLFTLKYEDYEKSNDYLLKSRSKIPKWFKDLSLLNPNSDPNHLPLNKTVKACPPFLDSLTAGYVVVTTCDIGVKQTATGPYLSWDSANQAPLRARDKDAHKGIPVPAGYSDFPFVWNMPIAFECPKDCSVLITHPFNRYDLPFISTSGIVDGGWSVFDGSIPFFVSKEFEGIIPKETPFAQFLPFKNGNWKAEHSKGLYDKSGKNYKESAKVSIGWYKSKFWVKKSYE